jgi:lipopolysaccharide export system protein LptC
MMASSKRFTNYFVPSTKNWLPAELRHSRRVAILRIALPATALLILAAVFLWPVAAAHRIIAMPPTPATPQLTMEQPRFTGTDEQNRPYTLSADRATQLPHDLMQVDLVEPKALLSGADGRPVKGSASIGRFDQSKKKLWLGGAVMLEQTGNPANPDDMTHFTTSELNADLTAHTIWGDKPARLTGAFGSIEGQGFRAYDGGKVLLFTGASRAILNGTSGFALPAPALDPKRE